MGAVIEWEETKEGEGEGEREKSEWMRRDAESGGRTIERSGGREDREVKEARKRVGG